MHLSWWTVALQAINFLALVWLLQRFLYKPVTRILTQRREQTQQALAAATSQQARAEEARRALEAERVGLVAGRQQLLHAARTEIAQERREALALGHREAEALLAAGRQALEKERAEVLADLRARAKSLALAMAADLLRGVRSTAILEAMLERIEAHLQSLAPERLAALQRELARGVVEVHTAPALDESAQARWRAMLTQRLGDDARISFVTDEGLITGAELRFPGAVLDFSWRGALAELAKEIEAHEQSRP